jgi:hypothetical protein
LKLRLAPDLLGWRFCLNLNGLHGPGLSLRFSLKQNLSLG